MITLREVTKDNIEEVIALKVRDDQKTYVSSAAESLAQAYVYSETAYDDAFRTMEGKCDDLLIPFVSHMFDENYDSTAVIKRYRNEHYVEHEDGSEEKRVTDSFFDITCRNVTKRYHLECESRKYDGTILNTFNFDINRIKYDFKATLNVVDDYGRVSYCDINIKIPLEKLAESGVVIERKNIEEYNLKLKMFSF